MTPLERELLDMLKRLMRAKDLLSMADYQDCYGDARAVIAKAEAAAKPKPTPRPPRGMPFCIHHPDEPVVADGYNLCFQCLSW